MFNDVQNIKYSHYTVEADIVNIFYLIFNHCYYYFYYFKSCLIAKFPFKNFTTHEALHIA